MAQTPDEPEAPTPAAEPAPEAPGEAAPPAEAAPARAREPAPAEAPAAGADDEAAPVDAPATGAGEAPAPADAPAADAAEEAAPADAPAADAAEEAAPAEAPAAEEAEEAAPAGTPAAEAAPEPAAEVALAGPRRVDWARIGWAAGVVAFLAALVVLASSVRAFTIPFLVAFTIAYLLDPVVDRFEARGVRRSLAILVLLLAFILVSGVLLLLFGPQVARELGQLPAKVVEGLHTLIPRLEEAFGVQLGDDLGKALKDLLAGVDPSAAGSLVKPVGSVASALYGGTTSLLAFLVGLVMVPVFAFYLLRDFDLIVARLADLVPMGLREPVGARFREIDHALSSFVRGQLLVASILAVLYAIGLSIAGLPLALVVALIAGLGNMIPYVGTTLGVVLATLMTVLSWESWGQLLGVWGVFAVVQLLEGWVITPRVVGESVGLSSLAVIVAVLVFGELFGFFGILVAVPLAAVLKILFRVAVEQYRASGFFRDA